MPDILGKFSPSSCFHCRCREVMKTFPGYHADRYVLDLVQLMADVCAGAPSSQIRGNLTVFAAHQQAMALVAVNEDKWKAGATHIEPKPQKIIMPGVQ